MQQFVHYFLHLVFPVFIAYFFFSSNWKKTYLVLLLTMLVDIDHLLADPLFDPCRCSIGFHPLHNYVAIAVYLIMLLHPKLRLIAIGLLLHMITDSIDCAFISQTCL
jgi:Family of unknown function (DUF6122)